MWLIDRNAVTNPPMLGKCKLNSWRLRFFATHRNRVQVRDVFSLWRLKCDHQLDIAGDPVYLLYVVCVYLPCILFQLHNIISGFLCQTTAAVATKPKPHTCCGGGAKCVRRHYTLLFGCSLVLYIYCIAAQKDLESHQACSLPDTHSHSHICNATWCCYYGSGCLVVAALSKRIRKESKIVYNFINGGGSRVHRVEVALCLVRVFCASSRLWISNQPTWLASCALDLAWAAFKPLMRTLLNFRVRNLSSWVGRRCAFAFLRIEWHL